MLVQCFPKEKYQVPLVIGKPFCSPLNDLLGAISSPWKRYPIPREVYRTYFLKHSMDFWSLTFSFHGSREKKMGCSWLWVKVALSRWKCEWPSYHNFRNPLTFELSEQEIFKWKFGSRNFSDLFRSLNYFVTFLLEEPIF